jgi:hypothetical protein
VDSNLEAEIISASGNFALEAVSRNFHFHPSQSHFNYSSTPSPAYLHGLIAFVPPF